MRWQHRASDPIAAQTLAEAARLPLSLAQLLVHRGIKDAEQARLFLAPTLADLHPPDKMRGMSAAIERLERALAHKEPMLIYGDYDVDGTTAVVILKTCLELLGGTVDFHVPHRIREGYGMKDDVIERAAEAGVRLVISVDTGIRAFQAAETAQRVGLDLIVTDHHLPEADMGVPKAVAVLNPNQDGCGYPCKDLCGAGVAFKIAQAMLTRAGREKLLPSFLKMVAIATIADAVSLTGENRVIAKLGLEGLRRPVNGGLKALMQVSQLENLKRPLTATDVGFRLAPRINAAGRMDIARDVVELFTCKNESRERELATKLNQLNSDRQAEEKRIVEEIYKRLEEDESLEDAHALVIDGDGWHRGVIGIVATRVVERTGKPALVVSHDRESGEAHGSGRSIPAFHLLDALESAECRPLFTRFGGHAHAVGFSLPCDRVDALRCALEKYAAARLTPEDFEQEIEIDVELPMSEVTPELLATLQRLEPFGMGNREPVFVVRDVRLLQAPKVMKEKHIKLRIGHMDGNRVVRPFDALGWRMAEDVEKMQLLAGDRLDLAFKLDENEHPDFGGLQMVLCDVRKAKVESAAAV